MKKKQSVAILLSTFNGDQYIEEQLNSLFNQVEVWNNYDIRLFIRDDGSTDNTIDILQKYRKNYPNIVNLILDGKNLGPKQSFFKLLSNIKADMYFFCDQDDIWLPNKMSLAIKEYQLTNNRPFLYYSALYLSDQNGKILKAINTKNSPKNLMSSLNENLATGATIMINDQLVDIYRDSVKELNVENLVMHDSYLFLLANLFGDVFFDNRPTILYRQHENNVVGASGEGLFQKIHKLKSVLNKMYIDGEFKRQASEFLKIYASKMSETQKQEFRIFLDEKKSFYRQWYLFRRLRMQSQFMNIGIKLQIILKKY